MVVTAERGRCEEAGGWGRGVVEEGRGSGGRAYGTGNEGVRMVARAERGKGQAGGGRGREWGAGGKGVSVALQWGSRR